MCVNNFPMVVTSDGKPEALPHLEAVFSLSWSWSFPYCLGLVPRDQDSSRHLLKSASNLPTHSPQTQLEKYLTMIKHEDFDPDE